jgi:signal transduction histidine kinase
VGHELRTPLAALRVICEYLLTDSGHQHGQSRSFLQSMQQEIVRMADTVDGLLEAARLNSGRAKWNWSRFKLHEACRDALESVRPLIDERNIELFFTVQPEELAMSGDADAIRRLILNLVNNSRKHTRSGSIRVSIDGESHGGQSWIRLRIDDTGSGIRPEIARRLGDAFALNAGVTGASHIEGSGLGLAICKGIVAAHGGTLDLTSAPGAGTSITAMLRADLAGPLHSDGKINIVNTCTLQLN